MRCSSSVLAWNCPLEPIVSPRTAEAVAALVAGVRLPVRRENRPEERYPC